MGGNTKQAANDRSRRGRAGTPGRGLHAGPRPAQRPGHSRNQATRRNPAGARAAVRGPRRPPASPADPCAASSGARGRHGLKVQGRREVSGPWACFGSHTTVGVTKLTAALRPRARSPHSTAGPQGAALSHLLRPQPRWQRAGRGTGTARGTARPSLARSERGRRLVGRRERSQ